MYPQYTYTVWNLIDLFPFSLNKKRKHFPIFLKIVEPNMSKFTQLRDPVFTHPNYPHHFSFVVWNTFVLRDFWHFCYLYCSPSISVPSLVGRNLSSLGSILSETYNLYMPQCLIFLSFPSSSLSIPCFKSHYCLPAVQIFFSFFLLKSDLKQEVNISAIINLRPPLFSFIHWSFFLLRIPFFPMIHL